MSVRRVLYHGYVPRRQSQTRALASAALVVLAAAASTAIAAPAERLERFRALAVGELSLAQILDGEAAVDAYREAYAIIDEEIVESLTSGSVFASPEFVQDRLDGFAEAWGGASLRLTRAGSVLVGAFTLGQATVANSVRVYGRLRGEPALLAAFSRDGHPSVVALPGSPTIAQFFAAWEGGASGRGIRSLRIDLVRQQGDSARVVWSTASLFPHGLEARAWMVRGREVRVRYTTRYPGWTPGCDSQTEQEDVYRLQAPSTMTRVSRVVHDAWHRELRGAAARLFEALATRDAATLASLVPDRVLRARLPMLAPESACDASDGPAHDAVSVAATAPGNRPWSLTFRREAGRWTVAAAAPVVPR